MEREKGRGLDCHFLFEGRMSFGGIELFRVIVDNFSVFEILIRNLFINASKVINAMTRGEQASMFVFTIFLRRRSRGQRCKLNLIIFLN